MFQHGKTIYCDAFILLSDKNKVAFYNKLLILSTLYNRTKSEFELEIVAFLVRLQTF